MSDKGEEVAVDEKDNRRALTRRDKWLMFCISAAVLVWAYVIGMGSFDRYSPPIEPVGRWIIHSEGSRIVNVFDTADGRYCTINLEDGIRNCTNS